MGNSDSANIYPSSAVNAGVWVRRVSQIVILLSTIFLILISYTNIFNDTRLIRLASAPNNNNSNSFAAVDDKSKAKDYLLLTYQIMSLSSKYYILESYMFEAEKYRDTPTGEKTYQNYHNRLGTVNSELTAERRKMMALEKTMPPETRIKVLNDEIYALTTGATTVEKSSGIRPREITSTAEAARRVTANETANATSYLTRHRDSLLKCDKMMHTAQPVDHQKGWLEYCVSTIISDNTNAGPNSYPLGLADMSNKELYVNYYDSDNIKDDAYSLRRTYLHELSHAYSYTTWNPTQRRRFANALGYKKFNGGEYTYSPTEKFANLYYMCISDYSKQLTQPQRDMCDVALKIDETPYSLFTPELRTVIYEDVHKTVY